MIGGTAIAQMTVADNALHMRQQQSMPTPKALVVASEAD